MRYVFGDCALDLDRRELTRTAGSVAVGPQVFDLLAYLVRNRDHVVSKDDILQAVWGGRVVSESTLTSHINAVRKAIGDSGGDQRLIRTVARKGFRFVGDVREAANAALTDTAPANESVPSLALPDSPSIAVLPFENWSGDPVQDYFADGIVEDIITALSRIRWLFVIARNSSFTYKGRAVDVKQVGRELGVRYVLEGSVRKVGNRVRISGQLVDTGSGTHLWAERFDSTLHDVFDLQDQVTASVVGAIAPTLESAEIERAKRKPTESLDAYDYYLRGMASFHRGDRDAVSEALRLFSSAVELDRDFASAYAMAAWCYFWRKINGWMVDRPHEIAEGTRFARRAIELGKDDAVALARSGHALAHLAGEIDGAIVLIERALVLNPNLAPVWFLGGFARIWSGEPEEAIARLSRAMRLSPLDPETFRVQAGVAVAHLLARRFDGASSWAERACSDFPSFLIAVATLAASHALAGRAKDAASAMRQLRQLDPALRLSTLGDWLPFRRPEDLALFSAGLREAGLPE